jgi:tellurite resistance protein TerC
MTVILEAIPIILLLILLEGLLSVDNAAILGAKVAHLPEDEKVPWPSFLQPLAKPLNKMFGNQRQAALKVGLLGAYLGRGIMLLFASVLVKIEWLHIVGVAYLSWLAIEFLASLDIQEEDKKHHKQASFWGTVLVVELIDLAFSIDNVIAAVALSDKLWVIIVGVFIGIFAMRYAAQIFTKLIVWEPNLKVAAYLLLLAIAIEYFFEKITHIHIGHFESFGISCSIIILTTAFGKVPFLKRLTPMFRPFIWASKLIEKVLKVPLYAIKFVFRMKADSNQAS